MTSPDRPSQGSQPAPVFLVCGDTAPQRRQLLARLRPLLGGSSPDASVEGDASIVAPDARIVVLDLVGCDPDVLSPGRDGPALRWQRYASEPWAEQVWQQLLPVLQPWSAWLETGLDSLERPASREIPGLDSLLACLYLADQCAACQADGADALIVVLPPLEQALPLLQLACRGPDLLEGLWRPLLLWWSQTRQRLAQVEVLLRLRLPAADTLELSAHWRLCLAQLAERFSGASVQVLLALAAEAEDLDDLGNRIVALPLCGLPRLRLWLDGDLPAAAAQDLEQQLALPLLSGRQAATPSQAATWLSRPLPRQTTLWEATETGTQRCRLFLPGLQRQGLKVQRQDHSLQIRSGGMRLAVRMPAAWTQLTCRSARVESPWLVIDFG